MTNRRFDSISGILNRSSTLADPDPMNASLTSGDRRGVPPEPPSVENVDPPTVTQLRPTAATQPSRTVPKPPARTSEAADGGVRRIAFRLDPGLHSALTARAAASNTSHGQIVLDSIEAAHDQGLLAQLVQGESPQAKADGLFPQLNHRTTARPTIPVEIRLPARAAGTLDKLVQETAAESRTQLIVASLRRHLT